MANHRFRVGQVVNYKPAARDHSAARGAYEVTRLVPEIDGEPGYQIKSLSEPHQRTARESQLRADNV